MRRWRTSCAWASLLLGVATGCAAGTKPQRDPTVESRDVPGIGVILVDVDGSTLYVSDQEAGGVVRCTGECAVVWPPLTVARGSAPVAGDGVPGRLATIIRPDGPVQVTYDGLPLYLYSLDTGPGMTKGDGLTEPAGASPGALTWRVATPDGRAPVTRPSAG